MAANLNRVILIGRVVREIELQETKGGDKVCDFSLAVNRRSKSSAKEMADFIDCAAFGRAAEIVATWCKKGTALVVIGELQNNNYEKDGVKHYSYKVIVREVQFAESKNDKVETSRDVNGNANTFEEVTNDDNLPF